MTTSHLCNGKWKPGAVSACSKHERISKKQTSVYRSTDKSEGSSGSDASSSSSDSA